MDNYLIIDLLEKDVVDYIVSKFSFCDWRCGNITGGHKNKMNMEIVKEGAYDELDNIVIESLVNNYKATQFTFPIETTKTIFSKISPGGQYPIHSDHPTLGHYSMTVFLNEPDEYDGGELQLYINGKLESIKLEKGKAIIYTHGTPHAVSKVTRGERLVAVNWTKSMYDNSDIRCIAADIQSIADYYLPMKGEFSELSFEETIDHPYFKALTALGSLHKLFATKGTV